MTGEALVHVPVLNTPYDVRVGEGVRHSVGPWVDAQLKTGAVDHVAVVADERVCDLHGELGLEGPTLRLPGGEGIKTLDVLCLLYTSPSPRDQRGSRMPSSA